MINFLKEIWNKIKKSSFKLKIIISLILVLYLFVITVTTVSINMFSKDDYYLLTPGEISRVDNVIKTDTIHNSGDIYTISVYEFRKVSLLQYWIAKSSSNYQVGIDNESYLSNEELLIQGTIMKDNSITNSIIVAYQEASKVNSNVAIDYDFIGIIVHSVSELAKGDIKQSDIITKVNDVTFNSQDEFIQLLEGAKSNMNIDLTVLREEQEIQVQTSFYTSEGSIFLGINGYEHYKINSATPDYDTYSNNTTGPSGGFMQSLAIYNSLIAKDITNGKRIVGTGTISVDGTVGIIGGVKQKVITANTYNADYMFVPPANYQDAINQYELLKNPSFPKPISISNFTEAIAFLEGLVE
ncbi:MAG: PDZ domain-containing protein [Bacilli bacterium]